MLFHVTLVILHNVIPHNTVTLPNICTVQPGPPAPNYTPD